MVKFSRVQPETDVQVAFLRLVLPGRPERNVGVFLLHQPTGSLYFRLREDWDRVAEADEASFCLSSAMISEIAFRNSAITAGRPSLGHWSTSFRMFSQLTERTSLKVSDWRAAIDRLFEKIARRLDREFRNAATSSFTSR